MKKEQRKLVLKKYRNYGCPEGSDDRGLMPELVLNWGLEEQDVGGLVMIMGENNCGKSNLLDALYECGNPDDHGYELSDNKEESDESIRITIGSHTFNGNVPDPIGDKVYKARDEDETFDHVPQTSWYHVTGPLDSFILFLWAQPVVFYLGWKKEEDDNLPIYEQEEYLEHLEYCMEGKEDFEFISNWFMKSFWYLYCDVLFDDRNELRGIYSEKQLYSIPHDGRIVSAFVKADADSYKIYPALSKKIGKLSFSKVQYPIPKSFIDKYGYGLSMEVRRFTPTRYKDSDLCYHPGDINNHIFESVFRFIGHDFEWADRICNGSGSEPLIWIQETDSKKKELSDKFNELIGSREGKHYVFWLAAETDMIRLVFSYYVDNGTENNIKRIPQDINLQSIGFTWLFSLYFEVLLRGGKFPGEIVVIDNFGDGLWYGVTKELVNRLREFGCANHITFVVATQSTAALGSARLDELRLVLPTASGQSMVLNKFDEFNNGTVRRKMEEYGYPNTDGDKHDVIGPYLRAIDAGRTSVENPELQTVYVEGMADYFLYNSFARALATERNKFDSIEFMPINGLGSNNEKPLNVLKALICFNKSGVLLVDGDKRGHQIKDCWEKRVRDEIGKSRTKNGYDKIKVIALDDISDFGHSDGEIEIEDLFSKNDVKKLKKLIQNEGLHKKRGIFGKEYARLASLSHRSDECINKFTSVTKNNFRKVIRYVIQVGKDL